MLAKTYGAAVFGVDANLITIEVNVTQGTKFWMVGLPDSAIKESEQRVESAIKHFNYFYPRIKIIVNLAPADIRKEGSSYDLPIALGILQGSDQVDLPNLDKYMIMGELSLDGILRPIKGVLPCAILARKLGYKGFILPKENAQEAAIVDNLEIVGVETMQDAIEYLEGKSDIEPLQRNTRELFYDNLNDYEDDFSDVQGHESVKRALEVSAAGGHNLIMIGPPGSGKTMLAKRINSILPPLTLVEALETTKIHSVAGKLTTKDSLTTKRPFCSPHHTSSDVALVGGGNIPQPGQISLAHNGVLFLDELPEFKRQVLEVMRQPLEDREVTISRAKGTVKYPANFMLIASMNPTPSGDFFEPGKDHPDSPQTVQRYMNKISGPLLDRIDIHVEVNTVSFDKIVSEKENESSQTVRTRVIKAREFQQKRFYDLGFGVHSNAMLSAKQVKEICKLTTPGKALLKNAVERLNLSSRAYERILKVSRTIADLAESPNIEIEHLAEAIQYRSLDREGWLK